MATPKMMSVELAIQRELAYRRRMETLQFGLCHASSSAAIPIPVQDSSLPSISGTKRKSPYIDPPVFPPQQPQSRLEPIRRNHRASRPIIAKLSCLVCMESFPNTLYLDKHCESPKHQNKIAKNRLGHTTVSNPFMCEICQATSSSRVSLDQHLLGRRHKQATENKPPSGIPRYPHVDIANLTWESV